MLHVVPYFSKDVPLEYHLILLTGPSTPSCKYRHFYTAKCITYLLLLRKKTSTVVYFFRTGTQKYILLIVRLNVCNPTSNTGGLEELG